VTTAQEGGQRGILACDRATLLSLVGEGMHTGLRKAAESPQSSQAWNAIQAMPDWGYVCEFFVSGLEYSGVLTWET
jgi:hypothetical protein